MILLTLAAWPLWAADRVAVLQSDDRPGHYLRWNGKPRLLIGDSVTYSATGEPFAVDLSAAPEATLEARWYNPRTGRSQQSATIAGGNAATKFTPPFAGDAVLHLRRKGP